MRPVIFGAEGFGPDWHLASVEVTHSGLNKTYVFPCNDWLRKTKEAGLAGCCKTLRQGGDVAGGPTQYRVTVVTSDLKGAGTDSNVSVVLYGSKGDTGEQKLDTASNNFERNKVLLAACLFLGTDVWLLADLEAPGQV